MKLRSLSLQLFRQHASTVLSFPDGLVGIIGSNGSGKTTILEAIGFALYGSRALRGRVEDVRTRNAPLKSGRGKKDQETRVELCLDHDGIIFRLVRTLGDASLYVGGEAQPVAVGNRDVSARISSIVGMAHDEFLSTYCTEQKGLEFLSGKKGATEREKFIVRMMGYDRLEEVQELIRSNRKEKRGVLTGFESSVGTREELELRLERESVELKENQERHVDAQKTLQKVEADFNAAREKFLKLEDLRARFLKEKEVLQAAQIRVDERGRRRQHLSDAIGLAEEDLTRALNALSGASNVNEALSAAKLSLFGEREKVKAKVEEIRVAELSWRESVSKAAVERDIAKKQFSQLEKRITGVGALDDGGECPTCGQALGESFEQVKKHFLAEQREVARKVRDLERVVQEVSVEPVSLTVLREGLAEAERVVRSLEAKLHELQRCAQLQQAIDAQRNESATISSDIDRAETQMKESQARLFDIRFSEDEYHRDKGTFDATQRLVEVARLQRVRLEGEVNTKIALVERTKAEIVKFDERVLEVDKLRREVRVCDECDRIVTEFRKFVNISIRPRMAELASEYLADLTDGRYSAVELGEDFTPTVIEDGEPKSVMSGGEEDILNLCMRISLSHMLAERAGQHFSLLMLDEVFGSLDEGRRSNVLTLLEKLRGRFEQIVIITHLDDVKDGVQHLIQVEYDEASGSAQVRSQNAEELDVGFVMNI
jgi:exonuclease SbcC